MIINFLFLLGPLLSGVWWGRVRHTWSCGGESAPEKAGVDQWWLMAAPRPLIGHPSAVLSSHWPAVSPLPGHHWPVNIGFLLQGAAAAPLCSSLGAGCCDSLLSVCCVGCAHGDQHHRHHRDHGDPGLQTQPRPRSQCQQIHSEPNRRSESGVYSNSSLTS